MENKTNIQLFGPVIITTNSQTHFLSGSIAKLITLLSLQEKTSFCLPRGRIAGSIWPETTEEKARHLLSNTLYRLKNLLGDDANILDQSSDSVGLVGIETDIAQFKSFINGVDPKDWIQAFELYQGDLAEEIDADWILSYRAELWEKQTYGLEKTCEKLWESAEYETGHLMAKKWITHDPINEEASYYLMRFLGKIGRQTAAIKQYLQLEAMLKKELDISPLPHVTAYYHALVAERSAIAETAPAEQDYFVGRRRERQRLISILNVLEKGNGEILLLEGDEGMGKTRLISELQKLVGQRQIDVAYGKGEDAAAPELLTPLSTALRQSYRPEWLYSNSMPQVSKTLLESFLLNKKVQRIEVGPKYLNPKIPFDTAFRHLFEEATKQRPLILCLDDVHWAEDSFWEILPSLCKLTEHRPLFVILSYRPTELAESKIGCETIADIETKFLPERITLSGLKKEELIRFADGLLVSASAEKIELIHQISQGNPYIAKELLLNDGEPNESVDVILKSRFQALSKLAQDNLKVAVILGNTFSYDIWQECMGGKIALQELLDGRFITQNDEANGYSFYHDSVRSYLYQQMGDHERNGHHRLVSEVLIRSKAPAELIAWHCEAANQLNKAVHYHEKAALNNLQVMGFHNARFHADAAKRIGEQVELSKLETLRLELLAIRIELTSKVTSEYLNRLEELSVLATELADSSSIVQIAQYKFYSVMARGENSKIEKLCHEMVDIANQHGDTKELIEILLLAANIKMNRLMKSKEGLDLIAQILSLLSSIKRNQQYLVAAYLLKTNAHLRLQQSLDARKSLKVVADLLDENSWLQSMKIEYLFWLAVINQIEGETVEAFVGYKALVHQYKAVDDIAGIISSLQNVSHIASLLGQHEEAIAAAQEVLNMMLDRGDVYNIRESKLFVADACILGGYLQDANKVLEDVIPWLRGGDAAGRLAREAWHSYGGLLFFQGKYEESMSAYKQLIEMVEDEKELTATPFLVYAESAKYLGKDEIAIEALEKVEELFDTSKQKTSSDLYRFYVFWLVRGNFDYLLKVRETVFLISNHITEEKYRRDYIERDPSYPYWHRAWHQETRPVEIELPSTTSNEVKTIELTFDYGEHDQKLLKEIGKVGLRQERLRRLIKESEYRRVSLTNAGAADLLGVNVRTIERDMQKIREAEQTLNQD